MSAMKAGSETGRARTAMLEKSESVRMYSSSALHAAKYHHFARAESNLLTSPTRCNGSVGLPAVAVVDDAGAVLGILRRERLSALLLRPFGREVLRRSLVAEVVEEVPAFGAHSDIFAVAELMLPSAGAAPPGGRPKDGGDFCVLLGEGGAFLALLASQDLANYLSRMTQDDIELAGRLQERLLAGEGLAGESREDGSSWRIEAWSRPAKGVGGDFYFTKRLDDGRLFLTLCDVSGKGVAASLIVSMVWGMLRMFDFRRGLRELVLGLNEAIVATFHMEKYMTGIFLVYDPSEQRVHCADMGHSHAVVFRGGSPALDKGTEGQPAHRRRARGRAGHYPYRLKRGDDLLVYSDGLIEQEDSRAIEFSERRLIAAASGAIGRGEKLREVLPAALDAHRGTAGPSATPRAGRYELPFAFRSIGPERLRLEPRDAMTVS